MEQLFGTLIGLARTMVSNEDLVTESTILTLLEGLTLCKENLNSDAISAMIERVTEEKKKLAPNCF